MLKQPAQMRMMEAMVVEASRWESFTKNTCPVEMNISICKSLMRNTNTIGNKYLDLGLLDEKYKYKYNWK